MDEHPLLDAELAMDANFPVEARLLLGCLPKGSGRALASTTNAGAEVQRRLDRIQIVGISEVSRTRVGTLAGLCRVARSLGRDGSSRGVGSVES